MPKKPREVRVRSDVWHRAYYANIQDFGANLKEDYHAQYLGFVDLPDGTIEYRIHFDNELDATVFLLRYA